MNLPNGKNGPKKVPVQRAKTKVAGAKVQKPSAKGAETKGHEPGAKGAEGKVRKQPAKPPGRKQVTGNTDTTRGRPIEAYYKEPGKFYTRNAEGGFVGHAKDILRQKLIRAGFDTAGNDSEVGREIVRIVDEHEVDYAGVVAGHPTGPYIYKGRRILVTHAPPITKAAEEPDEWLWDHIGMLLGPKQAIYFHGCVKIIRGMLERGIYGRMPAFIVAGDRNHGKSQIVGRALPLLFNDTQGDPFQYITGDTTFNKDLVGAVVLLVDDQLKDPSLATRRNIDAMLRQYTASAGGVRAHGKGADALMLNPLQWLVILCNSDKKSLAVLPQPDYEALDKIILLKIEGRAVDWPTRTLDEREAWDRQLVRSVPGYLKKLEEWEIPESYLDDRFGIKAWQNPELHADLQEMSSEGNILTLIENCHAPLFDLATEDVPTSEFAACKEGFEITARALYKYLCGEFDIGDKAFAGRTVSRSAEKLIRNTDSLGTHLSALAKTQPDRVEKLKRRMGGGGPHFWLIRPAKEEPADES